MHQALKSPLQVDFVGPLLTTLRKNRFLFVEAFPTRKEDSPAAAKMLMTEVFPKWGLPHSIDSDNGPAFIGEVFQSMGTWAGIPLPLHIPYHPLRAGGKNEQVS
ncbi:unnamed protein product [Lepidochelys kempii]